MKIKRLFSVLVTVAATGCATLATDDVIVKRTAFALGLDKSEFTISDRQNDGAQATYLATTKAGKKYTCYVEGYFSYASGRESSDAICNELGGKGAVNNCNALLKRAGKC
ncbi:hypothetical protein [Methylococcus sp. EFPC2]|uniref:hypothetical protein n=1 Tax=Methylococcus sp. EFPC2 TaxID=2812648 RepID=UPI0019672548|nr:hypothetical protein [Methylococcus sp. EFPC2]QSA97792.1 hypothetical protein JWZ97_02885 [Methylococcus sp. EFPC2]